MANPEVLVAPKSFWRKLRTTSLSEWQFAVWRELIQNSVDAGAKRIDISIGEAAGKGVFGRPASLEKIVRINFSDDGSGMDARILREVFLKPGETTKGQNEDGIGGFGTARVLLCWSQNRYEIRTGNQFVEGEGSEFTCQPISEAIESKRQAIAMAEAREDTPEAERQRTDMAILQTEPMQKRGCLFSIDIDPNEGEYLYQRPSVASLTSKLDEYLSYSQLPCKVFINGIESNLNTKKGSSRRILFADLDNNSTTFAKVHTSQSERARHKGLVIVRVNGAAMYAQSAAPGTQVIVEIVPSLSRLVLTQGRDEMRSPFRAELEGFLKELLLDSDEAMKNTDKRKRYDIKGGKGVVKISARDDIPLPYMGIEGEIISQSPGNNVESSIPIYSGQDSYRLHGFGGVPAKVIDNLLTKIKDGDNTFLSLLPDSEGKLPGFLRTVQDGNGAQSLYELGPDTAYALSLTLLTRMAQVRSEHNALFNQLHDIHIIVEPEANEDTKIKNAARRHNPSFWAMKGDTRKVEIGRGMQAHILLAAWTSCVEEAVRSILKVCPHISENGDISLVTGWYFAKSREQWNGREHSIVRHPGMYEKEGDVHRFLLNPITDEGNAAYDLSKSRRNEVNDSLGLQDLETRAIHQACEMLGGYKNSEFATLLTEASSVFDRAKTREAMRSASEAVLEAYGKGKTRIQAMEDAANIVIEAEEQSDAVSRPAERLLALAAPNVAMTAGIALTSGNEDKGGMELRNAIASVITPIEDNVSEVDCDALQFLEKGMAFAAASKWEMPFDLDALPDVEGSLDVLSLPGLSNNISIPIANTKPKLDIKSKEHNINSSFKASTPSIGHQTTKPPAESPPNIKGQSDDLAFLDAYSDQLSTLTSPSQRLEFLEILPSPHMPVVSIEDLVDEEFSLDDLEEGLKI
jgi:Histidine kinase-, DNA gyrase B-, and HSP90-like ATPase